MWKRNGSLTGVSILTLVWGIGAQADGIRPKLTIAPSGSEILLEGTDTDGVLHVLHSSPSLGIGGELTLQGLFGAWSPKFEIATQDIRFSGSNGENIRYGSVYYTNYGLGLEDQILDTWVVSGMVDYADELFLSSPSANTISIDNVRTPEASLRTSAGVIKYENYLVAVNVRAIAYFPVSTSNYSTHLGYGVQPSASTTHVFSSSISGTAEAYYRRRVQNSSVFDLTEQDFGLNLSIQFMAP